MSTGPRKHSHCQACCRLTKCRRLEVLLRECDRRLCWWQYVDLLLCSPCRAGMVALLQPKVAVDG